VAGIEVQCPMIAKFSSAGRQLRASRYSTFSVKPQNIPLGANLYQKLQFFAILGAVSPHFQSHNSEILHEGADLGGTPSPKPNFV